MTTEDRSAFETIYRTSVLGRYNKTNADHKMRRTIQDVYADHDVHGAWLLYQAITNQHYMKDALRYKHLRSQHWNDSNMFVVRGGKDKIRLGTDCPSGLRLDELIDKDMING